MLIGARFFFFEGFTVSTALLGRCSDYSKGDTLVNFLFFLKKARDS